MHTKLIITAAGAFGLGALWGWALGADHQQRRNAEREELLIEMLHRAEIKVHDLQNQVIKRTIEEVPWVSPEGETVEAAADLPVLDLSQPAADEDPSLTEGVMPEEILPEGPPDSEVLTAEDEAEIEAAVEEHRSNIEKVIEQYSRDPEIVEAFSNQREKAFPYDGTPPYTITQEEYAYDEVGEHHHKLTLRYYSRDRILVDEDEEVIDVPEHVGWKALSSFGDNAGYPDVVFVRNPRLLTDYEVEREDEEEPPLHVKYGMDREEFRVARASGALQIGDED